MGAHLERWTDRTPEPRPAFGLAREAERMPMPVVPADPDVVEGDTPAPPDPSRERGPFVTYLLLPWSYDRTTGESWHRLKCRLGRHEIGGGHTMQIGGDLVFVERRCRWCEAAPA
jgi:hypothetical protein